MMGTYRIFMQRCFLFLFTLLVILSSRAEVVYKNAEGIGWIDYSLYQRGQTVILAGTQRVLTSFAMPYTGVVNSTNVSARIRFYANRLDRWTFETGGPDELIYDSGERFLPRNTNQHEGVISLDLRSLSLRVADYFTWSVELNGMAGGTEERVGLKVLDRAEIGGNEEYFFWGYDGERWLSGWINGTYSLVIEAEDEAPPQEPFRPGNDDFANAVAISGAGVASVHGTLAGATREAGEPYNSNGVASVWYRWTPTTSGYLRIAQPPTVSAWMFTGDSATNLSIIARDGEKAWIEGGRTYYLGVFGSGELPGAGFEMTVETVPSRPENDDFVQATVLTEQDGKVVLSGSAAGATYEAGEPLNTNSLASVWFAWTPSISGRVRFLSDRPLPGIWFFYRQADLQAAANPFAGLVNTAREGQSPFLAAGITYYISVYAPRANAGEFHFQMELAPAPAQPAPPNDDFANATELHDADGYLFVQGTTHGSTFESGEPYYGNSFGAVWYKWRPSGRLIGFFPFIGNHGPRVFSGTALDNLRLVQDWQGVIPGQVYYLGVSGGGMIGTDFHFAVQVETISNSEVRPPNDHFENAYELKQASGPVYAWLEGATVESFEPAADIGCGLPEQHSVWYRFTAPVNGVFHIGPDSVTLSNEIIDLFTGDSLNTLLPVASETVPTGQKFSMTGGETYHVRARNCFPANIALKYAFLPVDLGGGEPVVKRLGQSITMEPLQDVLFGIPPFFLDATASSSLPLTFSVVRGSASVAGNLLTIHGGGFVTIAVTQPGNEIYEPAPEIRQTFRVRPAAQSLIFEPVDPSISPVQLRAQSSSGLPVTLTVISGAATISENVITESAAGPLTIEASQPGNETYEPAEPIRQTFIGMRIEQAINFPPVADIEWTNGAAGLPLSAGSFSRAASEPAPQTQSATLEIPLIGSASSGLPVAFSVRSGPGEVRGKMLVITGPGEVVLEAVQSGDPVFAPAAAQQTIRVRSGGVVPTPPPLKIVRTGSELELRWTSTGNFKMETAVSLEGPWSEVTAAVDATANEFTYRSDVQGASRFFRLR